MTPHHRGPRPTGSGSATPDKATLDVSDLTVQYPGGGQGAPALAGVSIQVAPGETLAIVGESGAGKSTLAMAAIGRLPPEASIASGQVVVCGTDWSTLDDAGRRRMWRDVVKFVPQQPGPALNPSMTIGRQVAEVLAGGRETGRGHGDPAVARALAGVGLADPRRVAKAYPHQLSGGMQQRVMIAMALARDPQLLVLDEPTTALDVTTEAAMLDLLRARIRRDTAVVYVSHNLGVVAQVADRVAVLYAGEVVEEAAVAQLFAAPLHPYTRGLLACLPRVGAVRKGVPLPSIAGRMPAPGEGPPGCAFAPRCSIVEAACETLVPGLEAAGAGRRVRCLRWPALVDGTVSPSAAVPGRPSGTRPAPEGHDPPPGQRPGDGAPVLAVRDLEVSFAVPRGAPQALRRRRGSAVAAVNGVDLTVARGETVALVGESGSGKTTVAAAIVGLLCPDGGSVTLQGRRLAPGLGGRSRGDRGRIQMVFQDPEEALNPYRTVGSTLARSIRLRPGGDPGIRSRVEHLLAAVGLAPYMADRWPGQLSGGEKQRVALARGLAPSPLVMLLDEPLSSLDVSVQAALLNTLASLQRQDATAYVLISHDLSVVTWLADTVAVLYLGQVVEAGRAADVMAAPQHPYTEALLSAVPVPDPAAPGSPIRLHGDPPSPVDIPSGCPFHPRCPRYAGDPCRAHAPPWRVAPQGKAVRCHIPLDDLRAAQEGGVPGLRP